MNIWVDGDACPVVIKEILFKAAERVGVRLILVANRPLAMPKSPLISRIQVAVGPDGADREIVARLNSGDLVITGDIPLAAQVIAQGGHALSPRGERYCADSIKSRLSVRDFMDSLRSSGVDTGGPPMLNTRDRQSFADQLDRFLTKHRATRDKG